MKLYYHKTDGGAEYYSIKAVEGTDEGSMPEAIMRVDGGEIEIYIDKLEMFNIKLALSCQRRV